MHHLVTATAMFISCSVTAETWTVDDDGPADFDNIQEAVYAAADGDVILIAPGTYTSNSIAGVVSIDSKSLTLQSSGEPALTILDGQDERSVISCSNCPSITIEGLTITRGGDSPDSDYGGGIRCMASGMTVSNCIISNNSISMGGDGGAGMICLATYYNDIYDPVITNCTFENNHCASYGGAIEVALSTPTITGCTFSNNTAAMGGDDIYIWYDDYAYINDSDFCGSLAPIEGPHSGSGNLFLSDCPTSCPDLNSDNLVGVADLLYVLEHWGQAIQSDPDGNDICDSSDIAILISSWGPCP
ncbi:MAG: right-handed parallel beta-helix repeat-containing protein [Phycisphaerales bacterium]|nr:right-handed parallel beta-helix repeat-containing protein [Phycisphaerales bacterium]